MKKKFYGALLVGSLFLAGGMVSCSDYDDDINSLNERVDEISKTLSSLQEQIGSYVKSVSYDSTTGKLTVVDGAGQSHDYSLPQMQTLPEYSLEVTADGKVILKKDGQQVSEGQIDFPEMPEIPDAFDPSKLTVGEDGTILYDGKETGVTMPTSTGIIALKNKDGVIYGYTITVIENGKETSATFYVLDAEPLKGLVFKPTCLVNGVPSLKAANIMYNEWTADKYEAPTENGEKYIRSTDESYITPQVWAYYHMNPSSVTKDQMASMKFLSEDVENYTRAAAMNPTVDFEKTIVTEDRLLKVAMNVDAEKIPSLAENKQALYALQVTTKAVDDKEGAVITSGYASIYKEAMTDFVLKVEKTDGKDYALFGQYWNRQDLVNYTNWGKAEEAIDNKADLSVNYDGTLNVADLISVYYKGTDNKFTELENIADYGFELRFAPSNYLGGDKADTEQNSFINEGDAAKGIFNPEYKGADSRNTIGRKPLMRVELVDVASNQIVTVGWVKVDITAGEIPGFNETFNKGEYIYGCANFETNLTYLDMNDVYAKAGLSKEEFHTAYSLLVEKGEIVTEGTGVVEEITSSEETQTNIAKWIVTPGEAKEDAKDGKIYVTMTYKSNDGTRGDITITLEATVAMPNGKVDNSSKIREAWFNEYSFIKADVNEPVATAASNFTIDLLSVFEGREVAISGVDSKFTSFAADKLNTKFQFGKTADVKIGNDVYTFSVSADGLTLKAAKNAGAAQNVATMDVNGVITYATTENAKALLNKSAYNVDPFTVGIEIVTTNDCGQVLPLTNNTFDVKFLRPINAYDKETASLVDATTGTAMIDMSKLMGLTDWRGEEFAYSPVNFYNYYGISNIEIGDETEIMTTLNASADAPKKLSEVAPNLNIDYKFSGHDWSKGKYGDIVYTNNDHTFHTAFQLYIPVTVTYTFGSVQTVVTLTINPTQGN